MPQTVATLDSIANILKEYYDDTTVEDLILNESPTIAALPKRTDFGGSVMPMPFMYSPTSGVSPSFPAAQASKADVSEERWDLVTSDLFSLMSIDEKAREAARGSAKSFVDLVETRADAMFAAANILMGKYIFGNGGGALAQIESRTATTITLTRRSDMHVFHRNSQIQPATTDGTSGAVINDVQVVSAVDYATRTLTIGAADAVNYVAGNFIFIRGGFGNAIRGLAAWFPTGTVTTAPFFGVNRLIDSSLVPTVRSAAALANDSNIEEALISLAADVGDRGGKPDLVIMNTRAYAMLVKQLGTRVVYSRMGAKRSDGSTDARIGFRSVVLTGPAGDIEIITDRNCPYNLVYMLSTKTCGIISMGKLLDWAKYEDDDSHFMRHGAENAMEARIRAYWQFYCRNPSTSGVADIGAAGLTLIDAETL